MARPKQDRKRTEKPSFRMTKGELALTGMKASIEGTNMSELVRRAVEAYVPTPEPETCHKCGREMSYSEGEHNMLIEANVPGYEKHMLVVTGVPCMKCECGEVTYDLGVACDIEELVDQLVVDALRYKKHLPDKISIKELFKEQYLGEKDDSQ